MSTITLRHTISQRTRNAPTGFSWTTLCFGPLVPLTRGWSLYALLMVVAFACTAGLSALIFPFIINRSYAAQLLASGYVPASDADRGLIRGTGIWLDEQQTDTAEAA